MPDEQADWLGQPAQAEALPASSDCGPTQPSLALDGGASEEDDMMFVVLILVEAVRDAMGVGSWKGVVLGDGQT